MSYDDYKLSSPPEEEDDGRPFRNMAELDAIARAGRLRDAGEELLAALKEARHDLATSDPEEMSPGATAMLSEWNALIRRIEGEPGETEAREHAR